MVGTTPGRLRRLCLGQPGPRRLFPQVIKLARPAGRHLTVEVLAERTADRVGDARRAVADYRALLEDSGSGETAMQAFIETNPWLLGLDCAKIRPRQRLVQGTMDFFVERFDGFHDVLELKDPHDPIIKVADQDASGATPPASQYALSPGLAQAVAQVHVYRSLLTRYSDAMEGILGLTRTRDPRLIIVIGTAESLPEYAKLVLTELNKSLHHVEVVPYDILATRAEAMLANIENYILPAH